jgi:hypothetical protein
MFTDFNAIVYIGTTRINVIDGSCQHFTGLPSGNTNIMPPFLERMTKAPTVAHGGIQWIAGSLSKPESQPV